MRDGRATWTELASLIDLSAPSTAERVRKLEATGLIEGYTACVNPRALGYSLLAFVALSAADPAHHEEILHWINNAGEVQECHIVAGEHDYLLKVRCRDAEHLERFLREQIRSLAGVRTTTTVVLLTTKETAAVPVSSN
jgi:Lrp/AsnC family leucine-responsive transcriptional regulator